MWIGSSSLLAAWEKKARRCLLAVGLDGTVFRGARRARALLAELQGAATDDGTLLKSLIERSISTALRENDGGLLIQVPTPGRSFSCRVGLLRTESGEPRAALIELDAETAAPTEFLNVFSHEIRTPLASLHGFAELLLNRKPDAPENRSHLKIIAQESLRLASVVRDFIDMERLESGDRALSLGRTDFNALVRATAETRPDASRIQLRSPAGPLWVRADAGLLARSLEILTENALTIAPSKRPVDLEVSAAEGRVVCTIAVAGARLPEEALALLFEKAYRPLQRDWPRFQAFSMALLERIAKAHSGALLVENTPLGVVFSISLPHRGPAAPPGGASARKLHPK